MDHDPVFCPHFTLDQTPSMHLMIDGEVRLPDGVAVTVRRGMRLVACDGIVCGMVAALVQNEDAEMTHVLLCRLPVSADYRLIPINQIANVTDQTVHLVFDSLEFT
jgi:hypothetical protein